MKRINQAKLKLMAKEIIKKNQYVSVASSDQKGNPWISPVCYSYDNKWNLYFASLPSSRHSKNIKEKKKIVCSIFDSRQSWGDGIGLQIEAKAAVLTSKKSVQAAKIYTKRNYPYGNNTSKKASAFINNFFIKRKLYRFYKISPKVIWINDPNSEIDARVKINLRSH